MSSPRIISFRIAAAIGSPNSTRLPNRWIGIAATCSTKPWSPIWTSSAALSLMVNEGLRASKSGKTIADEDLDDLIGSWVKPKPSKKKASRKPGKTVKLRWTLPAVEQLREIFEYIADDNPAAALRTVERIRLSIRQASRMPYAGRMGRVAWHAGGDCAGNLLHRRLSRSGRRDSRSRHPAWRAAVA